MTKIDQKHIKVHIKYAIVIIIRAIYMHDKNKIY